MLYYVNIKLCKYMILNSGVTKRLGAPRDLIKIGTPWASNQVLQDTLRFRISGGPNKYGGFKISQDEISGGVR